MGTDTPTEGREKKPAIKNEQQHPKGHSRHRNNTYIKKERFQGAHPDLAGFVFETRTNRTNQTANFARFDERIRALIGQS